MFGDQRGQNQGESRYGAAVQVSMIHVMVI